MSETWVDWALRKLRNRRMRGFPGLDSFYRSPDKQMEVDYQGRTAELFFSNRDETVHKWLHYLPVYDRLLLPYVGKSFRMLEIGVSRGGSLRLWRKLLGERAVIFGIDINPDCAAFDGKSGKVRIGSQDDPEFLRSVVAEMGGVDFVLDDGSHIASHQRASFDILFPLLAEGGTYVIEDLQTAYWPDWEGGLRRRGTAIEFLKDKIDEMHQHYQRGGVNSQERIPEIGSIEFIDSIAIITKRRQRPRYHVMVPEPERSGGG